MNKEIMTTGLNFLGIVFATCTLHWALVNAYTLEPNYCNKYPKTLPFEIKEYYSSITIILCDHSLF